MGLISNLFKNRSFRKAKMPRKMFKTQHIIDPNILAIEYDGKTRKYNFKINYIENGIQKIEKILYTPPIKYLIDEESQIRLKRNLYRYGIKAASSADLALYVLLEEFDAMYNTNYAYAYISGKFNVKLTYNFSNEEKYNYMSYANNKKANKCIHESAKKQVKFANAKIKKKNHKLIKTASAAALVFLMNNNINNVDSMQKINNIKASGEEFVNDIDISVRSSVKEMEDVKVNEDEKLSEPFAATASSSAVNVNNEENKNITVKTYDKIFTVEQVKKVDTLEEVQEKGYFESSDAMGYGLSDRFDKNMFKGKVLSTKPLAKSSKSVSCDDLNCDEYKISKILVYKDNKKIDCIDLTTPEKYHIYTHELYGMYGPNIEIKLRINGYKNDKLKKENIGYINIDKISCLTKESKKKIAKAYKPKSVKQENIKSKNKTLALRK